MGELFATVDLKQIGGVHQRLGLGLDRLHQMRMGMAERVDRDAGDKIHVASAILIKQPDTFATDEGLPRAVVRPIQRVVGRVG